MNLKYLFSLFFVVSIFAVNSTFCMRKYRSLEVIDLEPSHSFQDPKLTYIQYPYLKFELQKLGPIWLIRSHEHHTLQRLKDNNINEVYKIVKKKKTNKYKSNQLLKLMVDNKPQKKKPSFKKSKTMFIPLHTHLYKRNKECSSTHKKRGQKRKMENLAIYSQQAKW